jgi:hypothetical protein
MFIDIMSGLHIVIIDIFEMQTIIDPDTMNQNMSVFLLVSGILTQNHFSVMPMPAYVNFYNQQNINNKSPEESVTDFANNMWGTFLTLDYRNAGPKLVCFYTDRPSSYLDMKDNKNYLFRSDAFDLRDPSNPLSYDDKDVDKVMSNKVVGFKKSSGNAWGIIFPISELSSVQLNKGVWTMNFSNGNVQEAEFWYLVIKLKNSVMPSGSSGWWPLDLSKYPDRKSFKYGYNAEMNPCPKALGQQKERSIYPDAGQGTWYVGLLFDDNCDFKARRNQAHALAKEIAHYPNFKIDESAVITSNTHIQLAGPKTTSQGFAFSFFEMG